MIRYIKGEYLYYKSGAIVVETQGGIGFRIFVSDTSSILSSREGDDIAVYTYMHVSDNGMALYGFADEEGLSLFEQLISVNGVGPKAGLSIMSLGTPGQIKAIIAAGDAASVSQAQGVGKKTAERVILELKEKVSVLPEDILVAEDRTNAAILLAKGERNEAVIALTTLGYSRKEAEAAVASVAEDELSAEEYVKKSLSYLL
ncbi:MAG: Holliday junction branch migration protein RuvA [Mogibacterium sp.]|nr:Holliday junction branch migration protein RuvA [Mogibacterium sp.]